MVAVSIAVLVVVSIGTIGAMAASPAQEEVTIIHGEVTDADGEPAEGAEVDAIGDDIIFTDTADADGQFSIDVDPGTYTVQAFDGASDAASDQHEVTVESGESVEVTLVIDDAETPPPGDQIGIIEGTVTDDAGNPVGGVLVQADGEFLTSVESEADGGYSLGVEPGTYTLQSFDEATGAASDEHEVTVGADEVVVVDLVLDGDEEVPPPEEGIGFIEGIVTDESGNPVSGALVQAEGEFFMSAESETDGSYSMEVEPGTYEVSAFHEETQAFSEPVTVDVDEGETEIHDIELETFDGDGFEQSEYVADVSVEHVGGTAPSDLPEVDSFDSADGQISIDLVDYGQEMWMQELSGLGVDETTRFEIVVEFTDFQPRAVVAVAEDLDVSFDGSTMTVRANPLEAQWIEESPPIDDWPEGDDDRADYAFDAMLNLLVLNMDFPADEFDPADHPMTGLTIATDAQVFDMPRYITGDDDEPDRLEITIAGPHLTVDGAENDGIYQAFLPDSLLEEWNVESPDELDAAYKGEQTEFDATQLDDGILVEIDVSYSAGTVGISPAAAGDQPTPTTPDDGDDGSSSIPGVGIVGTTLALFGVGYLVRRRVRRQRQ